MRSYRQQFAGLSLYYCISTVLYEDTTKTKWEALKPCKPPTLSNSEATLRCVPTLPYEVPCASRSRCDHVIQTCNGTGSGSRPRYVGIRMSLAKRNLKGKKLSVSQLTNRQFFISEYIVPRVAQRFSTHQKVPYLLMNGPRIIRKVTCKHLYWLTKRSR
jgi:hypothetical protein